MIANADTQRAIFLSVALSDGSMEAFDNIDEAVAHATALVEGGDAEGAIFVAVPRAHVRLAVRVDSVSPLPMPAPEQEVTAHGTSAWDRDRNLLRDPVNGDGIDPVDPLPMPASEQKVTAQGTSAWERDRDLVRGPVNGDGIDPVDPLPMLAPEQTDTAQGTSASEWLQDPASVNRDASAIEENNVANEDRDNRTIALLEATLVSLEARLRHAQVDYRRACARGDEERINHARLRINAITAEQSRLTKNLSERRSGTVWPTSTPPE